MIKIIKKIYTNIKKIYRDYLMDKSIEKKINKNPSLKIKLPKSYRKSVKEYWGRSTNLNFHKSAIAINKNWDVRYLSESLFYFYITPKLNHSNLMDAYADKNKLDYFFDTEHTVNMILKNNNGHFYDKNNQMMLSKDVDEYLKSFKGDFIIKPSLDSGRGRGVKKLAIKNSKLFLNNKPIQITDIYKIYKKDYNIQYIIEQSQHTSKFHPQSLNTIRLTTFRRNNNIHCLSAHIRIGINGYYLDASEEGYVVVGINNDGTLGLAIDPLGNLITKHPDTNIQFSKELIPSFEKIKLFVSNMHQKFDYFDIISWDIAIDKNEKPKIIEFNLRYQGINNHQFVNGPLFGSHTDYIKTLI